MNTTMFLFSSSVFIKSIFGARSLMMKEKMKHRLAMKNMLQQEEKGLLRERPEASRLD